MEQVQIQLTGIAQVKVSKTLTVSKAQAQVILADDGAMQTLLAKAVNAPVKNWDHIFGQREVVAINQAGGMQCLTVGCGWVGETFNMALGVGERLCPKCKGNSFHQVQAVVERHG